MITLNKESDKLILGLSGRIDTGNAPAFEKELADIRENNPEGTIVLDASDLEYISSAGLRVVMKLRKENPDLKIINASPEVYDIFDMTGFTQMIDIKKKQRTLNLDGCQIIGKGGMGTVYRYDEDTIVKMFAPYVPLEIVERERELAQVAFMCGVPTAIAYDVVTYNGSYGLVFELIRADTLTNAINANPDSFDAYMSKYVDLLHQIHSSKDENNQMQDIKDIYREYIENLTEYLSPEEKAKLLEVLDAIPNDNSVVHGDLHSKNIMIQEDELLVIDMAELTHGSPLFDLFALMRDYILMGKFGSAEMYENVLGINLEVGGKIWESLLKGYFAGYSDEQLDYLSKLVSLGGLYSVGVMGGKKSGNAEANKPIIVEKLIKGAFLPMADNLIMMLKNYKYAVYVNRTC